MDIKGKLEHHETQLIELWAENVVGSLSSYFCLISPSEPGMQQILMVILKGEEKMIFFLNIFSSTECDVQTIKTPKAANVFIFSAITKTSKTNHDFLFSCRRKLPHGWTFAVANTSSLRGPQHGCTCQIIFGCICQKYFLKNWSCLAQWKVYPVFLNQFVQPLH